MGRWDPSAPGSDPPQASGRPGRYVPGSGGVRPAGGSPAMSTSAHGPEYVPGVQGRQPGTRAMLAGDRDGNDELRGAA